MNENDIEIKVLSGSRIPVEVGHIHPLTLREISDMGETKYAQLRALITFRQQEQTVIEEHIVTDFEMLVLYCVKDQEFQKSFLECLSIVFKESVHFHPNGFFYLGELHEKRIINEEKYREIASIFKKQNFLKDEEKDLQSKPLNDKAKELQDKLKEIKSKLKQQNNDDGLNLSDIISIVCSYTPNVNILNVWDLTIFQLYTLYLRLIMKENYESNLYLLPHSADPKSVDLKHWATKIKE